MDFFIRDWRELGVAGDEMGWPCNTHVEPLTVKVNLGMEKSATMVPNDPNQVSPRITSASTTKRTKRGTLKVNLLISSGVFGKRLLHSRNWLLPTIRGKGVMGAGLEVSRAVMRGWMTLCVLSQSTRMWGSDFGVGSKAVIAGVEFGFAVRAGACWMGVGWWMDISFWISARRPEMKQFSPKRSWSARENSSKVPSKWLCARCLYQLCASPGEIFLVVVVGYMVVVVVAVMVGVGVAVRLGGGVSGGYQILCLRLLFGLVNLLVDHRLMCLYEEAW
nr:hypothetical protein [Tanacetum cinerariifolium]